MNMCKIIIAVHFISFGVVYGMCTNVNSGSSESKTTSSMLSVTQKYLIDIAQTCFPNSDPSKKSLHAVLGHIMVSNRIVQEWFKTLPDYVSYARMGGKWQGLSCAEQNIFECCLARKFK